MNTGFGHGWGRRRIALAFIPLAALLAFAPQALAQVSSTTTVQASPATAAVGEGVVLTSTLVCAEPPINGRGVTFFDNNVLVATAEVAPDGTAELATSFITTGTHTIIAAYDGNGACGASNNSTTVEITEAPTPPTPPAGGLISFDNFSNGNTFSNIGNNY